MSTLTQLGSYKQVREIQKILKSFGIDALVGKYGNHYFEIELSKEFLNHAVIKQLEAKGFNIMAINFVGSTLIVRIPEN